MTIWVPLTAVPGTKTRTLSVHKKLMSNVFATVCLVLFLAICI